MEVGEAPRKRGFSFSDTQRVLAGQLRAAAGQLLRSHPL
jgi:hypothetical protein